MTTMEQQIQKDYERSLQRATQLNEARKLIMRLPTELRQCDIPSLNITVSNAQDAGQSWRKVQIKITMDDWGKDAQWKAIQIRKWLERNCLIAFDAKTSYLNWSSPEHAFSWNGVLHAGGFDFDIKLDSAPQPPDCAIVKKTKLVDTFEALCTKDGEAISV